MSNFDPVAWFVEGGKHSANVARNVAYGAFKGKEGIVDSKDLEVRELATPGTSVRIFPGTCAAINRAAGVSKEMYAARLPSEDDVPIAATGATARSDMIVARVVNPYFEGGFPASGWPALDPDPSLGPFVAPYVISNVPATATKISDTAEPNITGIPLARLDIPASTGTIDQAMIVDLRKMAGVLSDTDSLIRPIVSPELSSMQSTTYVRWPNISGCELDTEIPEWATHARVRVAMQGASVAVGYCYGNSRAKIVSGATTIYGRAETFDLTTETGTVKDRYNIVTGDTVALPAAIRGKSAVITSEALASSSSQPLKAEPGGTYVVDIEYLIRPESNL